MFRIIILLIVILFFVAVLIGQWNFEKLSQNKINSLISSSKAENKVLTIEMLDGLPEPVSKWLRVSGSVGSLMPRNIRIKQNGLMRTDPKQDKWMEASADQYFSIDPPSFVWNAKIKIMPLVYLKALDQFSEGSGSMLIKLFSIFNIANVSNEKINQAALQRYLAEIVWFPAAAISPYIKWEAIDSLTAKATITYKNTTGTGLFNFDDNGYVSGFEANRYKGSDENAELEKWVIKVKESQKLNGIVVSTRSDAIWRLKSGDFLWYQVSVTELEFIP